jgi:hypothetical protein
LEHPAEKIAVCAHTNRDPNKPGGLEAFLDLAAQNFELFLNIKNLNKKIKNLERLMSFSRPIQWYHSHADPIWPEGTF